MRTKLLGMVLAPCGVQATAGAAEDQISFNFGYSPYSGFYGGAGSYPYFGYWTGYWSTIAGGGTASVAEA